MKRILLIAALALFTSTGAFAQVVNTDLDSIIQIGLKENWDLKMKRMELKAAEKDIKIANPASESADTIQPRYGKCCARKLFTGWFSASG